MNNTLKNRIKTENSNAGFTLVELVVVLALIAIMASITIFGGLAWQDWSRFQHEDSVAEEIFFVAQNQLTELDSSGAMERVVMRPLKNGTGYVDEYILAYSDGTATGVRETKLNKVSNDHGDKYTWDSVWEKGTETSARSSKTNVNSQDEKAIVTLNAKADDFQRYLTYKGLGTEERKSMLGSEEGQITAGTVLLFDLISPYISDTAVLNGAIVLEFSPESGQVFAALYSDQASELTYNDNSSDGKISVCRRAQAEREPVMLGYYGVDKLTEKIKGKGTEYSELRMQIINDNILEIVLHENKAGTLNDQVTLTFTLYDGNEGVNGVASDDQAMDFSVKYRDINSNNVRDLINAQKNPMTIPVKLYKGIYGTEENSVNFRFPVWIDEYNDIHILLDGADVQAQTCIYSKVKTALMASENTEKAARFRNTYSFYRFGLADDVNYIYGSVKAEKNLTIDGEPVETSEKVDSVEVFSQNSSGLDHRELYKAESAESTSFAGCGECTTFASYSVGENANTKVFGINNARHLYNVRYETEYKGNDSKNNTFMLLADIDWKDFIGMSENGVNNYFLDSYNESLDPGAGISYSGNSKATGGTGDSTQYPFPSFRCLGKGDVFTQDNAYGSGDTSYTISNLTISFAANVLYGIYDDSIGIYDSISERQQKNIKSGDEDDADTLYEANSLVAEDCLKDDFSGLMGVDKEKENINSRGSKLARGGALPLGLFCENLGTITNITLNKHIVRGIEDGLNGSSGEVICTNMVGGFIGNNAGYTAKLTLLDHEDNDISSAKANITHINGRTDVGGIIGRESFVVPDQNAANIIKVIAEADGEAVTGLGNPRNIMIYGMKNYGQVTGMENVGGIVGRAYTHYVGDPGRNDLYYISSTTPLSDTSDYEKGLLRYKYYHDGYFISDNGKSMTGETVSRANRIIISNCINRGEVTGDEKYYAVGGTYNQISGVCAFIGGIAGVTMDGFIIDNYLDEESATKQYREAVLYGYLKGVFYGGSSEYVTVRKCSSFMKQDPKTYSSETYNNEEKMLESIHSLSRDYYVGGLVGYARLTSFNECNETPDEDISVDETTYAFVTGVAYVGGIAGCSDYSKYTGLNSEGEGEVKRDYYATNYNNVIGRAYVGGIAGVFGIGNQYKSGVNFRDPSLNANIKDASRPNKISGEKATDRLITGQKLLNKGAVLALKGWKYGWFEAGDCLVYNQLVKTESKDKLIPYTGGAGGISGAIATTIADCDSLQSEGTKKMIMYLVTGDDTADLYTGNIENILNYRDTTLYGGNAVGGIVGVTFANGLINPGNQNSSLIDSFVYGRDRVGGAVGIFAGISSCGYFYPVYGNEQSKGLLVVGEDMLGGLIGDLRGEVINEDSITAGFTVRGRYAIGGIVGDINIQTKGSKLITKIKVELEDASRKAVLDGVACVGGCIGLSDAHPLMFIEKTGAAKNNKYYFFDVSLKNMTIKAKYFAGGIYGGIISEGTEDFNNQELINETYNNKLNEVANRSICDVSIDSSVSVNSEAFSGGMVGYYSLNKAHINKNAVGGYSCVSNREEEGYRRLQRKTPGETDTDGWLSRIVSKLMNDGTYGDYRFVYNVLISHDIKDNGGSVFSNRLTGLLEDMPVGNDQIATASLTVDFINQNMEKIKPRVEANLFAGGLVGYIPDSQDITIKNYTNYASVHTTGYVGGDSGVDVPEAYGSSEKYSYMGAVIGRVPRGMTIVNCSNAVSGVYSENAESYYSSDRATYLGGLTEVNAGVIQGTSEESYTSYSLNLNYASASNITGVGGIAGVNGTGFTDGTGNGIIKYCSNSGNINARNAAGIAAAIGGSSTIESCVNSGNITGTGSDGTAAGIAGSIVEGVDESDNVDVKIDSCVNIADFTNSGTNKAGIVYSTGGVGDITMCRNYGRNAGNGITAAAAKTIYKNMEAGGLNEEGHQIASGESGSLSMNFYVYGTASDDAEPATTWPLQLLYDSEDKALVYYRIVTIKDEEGNETQSKQKVSVLSNIDDDPNYKDAGIDLFNLLDSEYLTFVSGLDDDIILP